MCHQVSNTSVTDTETQFQMSSDSGSRVQLTEASKQDTTAKIIPESQVKGEDTGTVWLTILTYRARDPSLGDLLVTSMTEE